MVIASPAKIVDRGTGVGLVRGVGDRDQRWRCWSRPWWTPSPRSFECALTQVLARVSAGGRVLVGCRHGRVVGIDGQHVAREHRAIAGAGQAGRVVGRRAGVKASVRVSRLADEHGCRVAGVGLVGGIGRRGHRSDVGAARGRHGDCVVDDRVGPGLRRVSEAERRELVTVQTMAVSPAVTVSVLPATGVAFPVQASAGDVVAGVAGPKISPMVIASPANTSSRGAGCRSSLAASAGRGDGRLVDRAGRGSPSRRSWRSRSPRLAQGQGDRRSARWCRCR